MFSMNYSTWHFSYCTWDPDAYAYTTTATDNDEAKHLRMTKEMSKWPFTWWAHHAFLMSTLQQMSAIGLLKHHSLHSCHIHKRNAPSNFMSSIDCFRSCSSLVAARYHLPVVPTCGVWMSPFAFRSPSAFTETKDPANTKTPSFLMMVHWM